VYTLCHDMPAYTRVLYYDIDVKLQPEIHLGLLHYRLTIHKTSVEEKRSRLAQIKLSEKVRDFVIADDRTFSTTCWQSWRSTRTLWRRWSTSGRRSLQRRRRKRRRCYCECFPGIQQDKSKSKVRLYYYSAL